MVTSAANAAATASWAAGTSAGLRHTVTEDSSTTTRVGTPPASANAVQTGESVFVLGLVYGTGSSSGQWCAAPGSGG